MNFLKRTLGILFLTATAPGLSAQTGAYWSDGSLTRTVVADALKDGERDHLAVRPLRLKYLPEPVFRSDTGAVVLRNLGTDVWTTPERGKWAVDVLPVFRLEGGMESAGKTAGTYTLQPGVAAHLRYGKKWSLYFDARGGTEKPPTYIKDFIRAQGVVPSMGRNLADEGPAAYFAPTARLSFSPSPYFEFELGYGQNFFGYGVQSLQLGDVASNYPYVKIVTDVWNVQYVNIFSALTHLGADPGNSSTHRGKFTSTHYLDWAITPRLNVGLFESIIWQAKDTLSDRGFDPNYLNPVIFYRPVEYAIGSPDNALMGLDVAFKATKHLLLYGQVVIDEFLLEQFRDNRGWWANKWGAQLGVASYEWPVAGLHLRAEFNTVRPFSYTHGSPIQSFTHYNEPLAHRLGTNFRELYVHGYYERDRYFGSVSWTFAQYGRDPEGRNLGGDIFRSYVDPARIYGNHITQGIASTLFFQEIEGGFILNKNVNLRLSLRYGLRALRTSAHEGTPTKTAVSHFPSIALSTALYARHRHF